MNRVTLKTNKGFVFQIDDSGDSFIIYKNGKQIGKMEVYDTDEDGKMWLNSIDIDKSYHSKGIGTKLIEYYIDNYGEIYFAAGMQNFQEINDGDTRHLSCEGAKLMNSLLRNGILKDEWCYNPTEEDPRDYDY